MVPDDYIQPEKHPNLLIINGINFRKSGPIWFSHRLQDGTPKLCECW